jgi:hypothetical protein
MQRRGFCAALIGALFAGVVARGQTPENLQRPPANRFVAVGCVSREPASPPGRGAAASVPRFLITDNRGDTPTVYRLDGDEAGLTFHVGHTVEVSGPLSVPPAGLTGSNAKALILKVNSLTYVSPTCKFLK